MFALMVLACLARIFNYSWFKGTLWLSVDNPILQVLLKVALLAFDVVFLSLIFETKSKWILPIAIIALYFVPVPINFLVELYVIIALVGMGNKNWNRGLVVYAIVLAYGFLVAYGRYGAMIAVKDVSVVVAAAWDYKLLYVVIYLFFKLGGVGNEFLGMARKNWQRLYRICRK